MVLHHVHAHVNCDGTVIPHAYVLSEMVISHIVCDGTVIPHACVVLSEMVIPHIVCDGIWSFPMHVLLVRWSFLTYCLRWDGHSPRNKKNLRWEGHSPRRDSVFMFIQWLCSSFFLYVEKSLIIGGLVDPLKNCWRMKICLKNEDHEVLLASWSIVQLEGEC